MFRAGALSDFTAVVDENLRRDIFSTDPQLLGNGNVYVGRQFAGTLQQLFIVRNWEQLTPHPFTPEELWVFLRANEFRTGKLVFGGRATGGELLGDESARTLIKQYYYRDLWANPARVFSPIVLALLFIIATIVFYFIADQIDKSRRQAVVFSPLEFLEAATLKSSLF